MTLTAKSNHSTSIIWRSSYLVGQVKKSSDRINTRIHFTICFYERYYIPAKVQNLRLSFQGDDESTLNYFDHLKILMVEIIPDFYDNWIKHNFAHGKTQFFWITLWWRWYIRMYHLFSSREKNVCCALNRMISMAKCF